MATRRLYYEDAYIRRFEAEVISCEPKGKRYEVVLDQTAFFPEGGGQAPDLGALGAARVLDVQERGDGIVHTCDRPLSPGECVAGEIDWARRFRLMQQHSGEHLVSGLVHERYGWNNVGFHMGADCMTIDFSGPIPPEDIPGIERAANEAVWADLPSEVLLPTAEELEQLHYRSKKALTGQVRLVRFPGTDLCACCGTHVARTGEIGLIKILSCIKFREGVRIEMMCGAQALDYLSAIHAQNHEMSTLLSAKPMQTAKAVRRVLAERDDALYRLTAAENQRFEEIAEALGGAGDCTLFEPNLSPDGVRKLAVAVMERCGGRCAVFSGDDEAGYKYALGQTGGDLRELVRQMNASLSGRGGGKPFFAQGSVGAKRAEIEAFFAAL